MKNLYLPLALLTTFVIGLINVRLYSPAPAYPERKQEVLAQLKFLEEELKERQLGHEMQQLFPEGYVFINALYGLAWAELAIGNPEDNVLQEKAQQEALFAYQALDSEKGKSTFSQQLIPSYGIFYVGWKNYLLAKYLSFGSSLPHQDSYRAVFEQQCHSIAHAMRMAETPFLSSYGGQAWPADMSLAVASLAIHDKLYQPKYQKVIQRWLKQVQERIDPETGMVPHKVDANSGVAIETPRGGSTALMVRLLAEIDPAFGQEHYQLFKKHFVSTALGLPAVREYPKGKTGKGDVDSGPVILDVGFPATMVAIGTFHVYGEKALSKAQFQTVHAFGFPFSQDQETKYLLGLLPMADAFIAWSRATGLTVAKAEEVTPPPGTGTFHLISLAVLLLIWLPWVKPLLLRTYGRFLKKQCAVK